MMTPQDALAAMEEQQIYRNIYDATTLNREASEAAKNAAVFEKATRKILTQQAELKRLTSEIARLNEMNSTSVAVALSAGLALADAATEIAKLKSVPLEEAEKAVRIIRTKHFNSTVNRFVADGFLRADPRITEVHKTRAWYVPGLDPEHGM